MQTNKKNILFLCTGNSCRSQMAHGWAEYFWASRYNVYSAGITTHGLNPNAVQVMAEQGVDISAHTSNNINEYADVVLDYVITVCGHANETCPLFHAATKVLHVGFEDPPKLARELEAMGATPARQLEEYRRVAGQIKQFVLDLPAHLGDAEQ